MDPHSPSKRVAVITGAGSGIGRAAALALLREGYSAALAGRRPAQLQETAELAGDAAARALLVPTDVADPRSVGALFESALRRFGRVDLLFNNAGIFPPATPLEEVSHADWQRAVDINLTGAFLCTQAAFRIMKSQQPRGGRIIHNGSLSAHVPRPHAAAYTATKHALSGLTKSTALEGRAHDIACGQLDIGNAATELTAAMAHGVLQADGSRAPEATMDVEHVARAVVYMASLPLDANVQSLTILATRMPFVGRG
jgi:NAD(P)-dependent dehydrogenase (short-subunit alcohol dehydrogenase family)